MKCRHNICFFLAILIVLLTLSFNIPKGSGSYPKEVRRGYLLDRSGEPLVINKESFQGYLIVRGKSLLGKEIPEELKPYLPPYFELPSKGLVPISENLTFEEAQKLSKIKDVVVKGEIRRTLLFRELRPLLGIASGSEGISGVEKAFNERLKKGESLTLSLDLNICKKIYNYAKHNTLLFPRNLAIFKKDTGELLAFYSGEEKNFLAESFLIRESDFPFKLEEVNWELEAPTLKREGSVLRVTPLHLVQALLSDYCGAQVSPTLILRKENTCKKAATSQEPLLLFLPQKGEWLYFLPKENTLYVFSGTLTEEERGENFSWEKFKKNLNYLAGLF